jgi:hypothetical protein
VRNSGIQLSDQETAKSEEQQKPKTKRSLKKGCLRALLRRPIGRCFEAVNPETENKPEPQEIKRQSRLNRQSSTKRNPKRKFLPVFWEPETLKLRLKGHVNRKDVVENIN